jgi:quercetin dioxygenase-like cupin family protein
MNDRNEVILETENVRVRIMALDAGEATAWHFHSEVTDRMLCLQGPIAVEYQGPRASVELACGERCEVAATRIHRVVNRSPEMAKYLLVQGVGLYDFNTVEP